MLYTHLFQWNVPKDNQFCGYTGCYINVVAEWNSESIYNDGSPIVSAYPVVKSNYDLICVKDWYLAIRQMEKIAQSHFAEIARQEKINQARAVLIAEEESVIVSIAERFQTN
jgi:hypothetical protein